MTFEYKQDDILKSDAEAIINTVNCVGIMGKGLAKAFKEKFPENYKKYKKYCDEEKLHPGHMFVTEEQDLFLQKKILINFPTKNHWRENSKYEYIEQGLDDLIKVINKYQIKSIAIPPLGCGNGGLDWVEVHKIISNKLKTLSDVSYYIYAENQLKMTENRALIIKILHEFSPYFYYEISHVCAQKIIYFLSALGVEGYPHFEKNRYGPYSKNLEKAFISMEREGYLHKLDKDFSDNPDALINITDTALIFATDYFNQNKNSNLLEKIEKLSQFIEGFEDTFSLELLSSVYWAMHNENCNNLQQVISFIHKWTKRKKEIFSAKHIKIAYHRVELLNI